ncbi:hypothetical protein E2C01_045543 [Portunus trituberculatus]|uniref:Uncharacterized protein n=1 Tax=Portunus trituberculatus TaxID=210409 RepID=A0A5B7FW20_PORTR|nr:hypothetical protein [Portunus trituberculatus]
MHQCVDGEGSPITTLEEGALNKGATTSQHRIKLVGEITGHCTPPGRWNEGISDNWTESLPCHTQETPEARYNTRLRLSVP